MMLSIIIPVYNAEKYIATCLQSIFEEIPQTEEIEILLIDDGSTDRTKEKYGQFADERLKVYSQCNQGVSAARNYGIEKASGTWILFVDVDDFLVSGWYEIIKKFFLESADIIIFNQGISDQISKAELLYNLFGIKQDIKFLAGVYSKLYRRSALVISNRTFNKKLINGEDMIFNTEILLNTDKIVFCRESIYYVRVNVASSTKHFDLRIIESDKDFHEVLEQILKESNLEEKKQQYIRQACLKNAVFILTQRFSYIDSYKVARKYFGIFSEYPYSDVYISRVENKKDFIILCVKRRYYRLAYIMCHVQRKIKYCHKREYVNKI